MHTKSLIASAAAVAGLIAAAPSIPATGPGVAPMPPAASRTTWMSVPPVDPRGAAALLEIRPTDASQTGCIDPLAGRRQRA
jgi:hypothetical protein